MLQKYRVLTQIIQILLSVQKIALYNERKSKHKSYMMATELKLNTPDHLNLSLPRTHYVLVIVHARLPRMYQESRQW